MTIQKRNRFTDTENKFMVPKGEREGEGINQKQRPNRYKLLYRKYASNRIYLTAQRTEPNILV